MEITRIKDISETNVNYFLKGLLFAQEIYVHSSIDHFYENYEDKYRFLFNRGSATDEIFFQGGSAEGLSILRIEEFPEPTSERSYKQLKWKRHFDFGKQHFLAFFINLICFFF